MTHGNRFGSVDEDITYTRDEDGTVRAIRAGGGMSQEPWSIPDERPEVAAGLAS
jgi:D-alanyl-D-alanine carboxypeptidase